jgi:hypothetical protein
MRAAELILPAWLVVAVIPIFVALVLAAMRWVIHNTITRLLNGKLTRMQDMLRETHHDVRATREDLIRTSTKLEVHLDGHE